MKVAAFHESSVSGSRFEEMKDSLATHGLTPIIGNARQQILSQLTEYGFSPPTDLMGAAAVEAFAHAEGGGVLLKHRGTSILAGLPADIDILVFSLGETEELESLLANASGTTLRRHSSAEARILGELEPRLGELSPNGRHLADDDKRVMFRLLYDDDFRQDAQLVGNTFGRSPVPRSALEQLEPFNGDNHRLDEFLTRPGVFSSMFALRCGECDASQLRYPSVHSAESALADSGRKCLLCGTGKIEIVQLYGLTEPVSLGVSQGLWLESLASDVISKKSELTWTGQMVESHEIDVLCIYSDILMLVECKDTSFGQTDLAKTALKADRVSANHVVILTTEDLHHNVSDDIERMKEGSVREFHVVSKPSSREIGDALSSLLDELAQVRIRNWLDTSVGAYRPFFPGLMA